LPSPKTWIIKTQILVPSRSVARSIFVVARTNALPGHGQARTRIATARDNVGQKQERHRQLSADQEVQKAVDEWGGVKKAEMEDYGDPCSECQDEPMDWDSQQYSARDQQINPRWRTSTVIALCRRMLDSRTFDVLPILADALQDAGCDDAELLGACQTPNLATLSAERIVNLVYSGETAGAVRWLEQFAYYFSCEGLQPTLGYESIVQAVHEAIRAGSYSWDPPIRIDFLEISEYRREFFRNWSIVTGVDVPETVQDSISFR
jgi:hypothetical protein